MDDTSSLISRLRSTLNPRVEISFKEAIWPKFIPPIFKDIEISATLDGASDIYARGVDINQDLAIKKSFSECVERLTFNSLKEDENSSGWAAHTVQQQGILNSKLELIERDSFLCHYLTSIPMKRVKQELPPFLKSFLNAFWEQNIVFDIYNLRSPKNIFVKLFLYKGKHASKKFSYVLGLGCDFVEENALYKSFLEATRSLAGFLNHYEFYINSNFEIGKPITHKVNAFKPIEGEVYDSFFLSDNQNNHLSGLCIEDIDAHFVKQDFADDIKVFRSEATNAQNFYFGNIKSKNINIERLEEFANTNLEISTILKRPIHPLG